MLGNDAAATITVSLVAAVAGLALAGWAHCGEQLLCCQCLHVMRLDTADVLTQHCFSADIKPSNVLLQSMAYTRPDNLSLLPSPAQVCVCIDSAVLLHVKHLCMSFAIDTCCRHVLFLLIWVHVCGETLYGACSTQLATFAAHSFRRGGSACH
jgi:hypothetical protein